MAISKRHRWTPNFIHIALCIELSCLLLFKHLFKHRSALISIQYLRRSSIKLFNQTNFSSHYQSSYKGLCQNKYINFGKYTKGCHFWTAHITLIHVYTFYYSKYFGSVFSAHRNCPRGFAILLRTSCYEFAIMKLYCVLTCWIWIMHVVKLTCAV